MGKFPIRGKDLEAAMAGQNAVIPMGKFDYIDLCNLPILTYRGGLYKFISAINRNGEIKCQT